MSSALLAKATPQAEEVHQSMPWDLEGLVASTQACFLRPLAFFISWNGVLTLAYKGFPPALRTLKQNINTNINSLPRENPGSRWPKTSLGAVKEGKRLTPEQFHKLNAICREMSGMFQAPQSPKSQAVLVDQVEVVFYECRCLERILTRHVLPLARICDPSEPSADEAERVAGVVAEADDPGYWYHVSRDGSREGHYRDMVLGVTLVHSLTPFTGRVQPTLPFTHTTLNPPTGRASPSVEAHSDKPAAAAGALSRAGSGVVQAVSQAAHAVLNGPVGHVVTGAVHGLEAGQGAAHKAAAAATTTVSSTVGAVLGWWAGSGATPATATAAKGQAAVVTVPPGAVAGTSSAPDAEFTSSVVEGAADSSAAAPAGVDSGTNEANVKPLPPMARTSGAGGKGGQVIYGSALPGILATFRTRVDSELPELYAWFNDSSLHITIRALMG